MCYEKLSHHVLGLQQHFLIATDRQNSERCEHSGSSSLISRTQNEEVSTKEEAVQATLFTMTNRTL